MIMYEDAHKRSRPEDAFQEAMIVTAGGTLADACEVSAAVTEMSVYKELFGSRSLLSRLGDYPYDRTDIIAETTRTQFFRAFGQPLSHPQ
jgi:hypothetical protein